MKRERIPRLVSLARNDRRGENGFLNSFYSLGMTGAGENGFLDSFHSLGMTEEAGAF